MKPIDLLITNGFVITQNQNGDEYPSGAVAIDGAQIVEIGDTSSLISHYDAKKTIDARDKCVFPGFINTHTHLFQTFMKGLGEGIPLFEWLRKVTTPGILHMGEDDFYLSAMIGCLDAIQSGTTTLVEFMYPNPFHEMGDAIFQALSESGMRALLGRGVADIGDNDEYPATAFYADLLEPLDEAMSDCVRLAALCKERGEERIGFCLAPPNVRTIKPSTFKIFQDFAHDQECMITTHISETSWDNEIIFKRHGLGVAEWLEQVDFLNSNLLAVHCVHPSKDDIQRFEAKHVKVSYNPVSNMYLGDGIAPIRQFLDNDITVSIGTDGAASNNSQDMLEVIKTGLLLQRAATQDPSVLSSKDMFRMATIDGARSIGLSDQIGSLESGKKADVVIADFNCPISAPYYNPISTLVFSSSPEIIDTVIIHGRVVLEDRQFQTINIDEIVRRAHIAGHRLANRSYGKDVLDTCKIRLVQ